MASTENFGHSDKGFTVVIAMDNSEFSDYALEFYLKTIHKLGNKVILAHVAHYKSISSNPVNVASWDPAPKFDKEEEKKSEELKQKLATVISQHRIDASIECVHGDYGPAICTVATDNHADFIVVGCRGRGAVSRLIKGSVTDFIAHHSSVPVIIARSKELVNHKNNNKH